MTTTSTTIWRKAMLGATGLPLALAFLLTGCDGAGACGEGTQEVEGECRPLVAACGEGATAIGGQCVAVDSGVLGPGPGGPCDPACEPGETCFEGGRCVPDAWTCGADFYRTGEFCDCGCGAPDPDCDLDLPVHGCHSVLVACNPDGTCAETLPAGWLCGAESYGDGLFCHCGCGAPDPDCATGHMTVLGCETGVCRPDGTCGVCEPACAGVQCGSDGCGGQCGACDLDAPYCHEGACVSECRPDCEGQSCGADGCGGSCGECPAGQYCQYGHCDDPAPQRSCEGRCGELTPGGCSCVAGCIEGVTCCVDWRALCSEG